MHTIRLVVIRYRAGGVVRRGREFTRTLLAKAKSKAPVPVFPVNRRHPRSRLGGLFLFHESTHIITIYLPTGKPKNRSTGPAWAGRRAGSGRGVGERVVFFHAPSLLRRRNFFPPFVIISGMGRIARPPPPRPLPRAAHPVRRGYRR